MSGKIKGFVVLTRKALLTERFGADAWGKILAGVSEDDRAVLDGVMLPSSWLPLAVCERLDEAIIRVIGGRAEEAFKQIGRRSCDDNLTKYQSGFLRGNKTPQKFLEQSPAIYRLYYETGSREYKATGEHSGVLTTTGAHGVTWGDCLTIIGWHERALELCGAHRIKISHPVCRTRGGTVCRYDLSWDELPPPPA